MRKLLFKLALLLLPIGIIVITTNYMVDPANIFSGEKYVNDIATLMVAGNNVDNVTNYDERLLQQKYLEKQKLPADVLVMGSSRIMEISRGYFPGREVFNIGVSHGNINDMIALAGLMDSLKIYPKEVWLNTDPALIARSGQGDDEWQTLREYHSHFISRYCTKNSITPFNEFALAFKKYYTLFTFDYFGKSIEFVWKKKSKKFINIGKAVPQIYGRFSDGSIGYPDSYKFPDTNLIHHNAREFAKKGMTETEEGKLTLLNCLIQYFRQHQVKVNFLLMPFHPEYYSTVNNRQNNLLQKAENVFRQIAKQNQIDIFGSFSPEKLGLHQLHFYDAMHCNEAAIKKVLSTKN